MDHIKYCNVAWSSTYFSNLNCIYLLILSETSTGGVLALTDEVMAQLKEKHPNPQPTALGSLLFGPINDDIPESVYSEINGEMIREAVLRTKGSGGP